MVEVRDSGLEQELGEVAGWLLEDGVIREGDLADAVKGGRNITEHTGRRRRESYMKEQSHLCSGA